MWTTLESILTNARAKIGQALAEDRPTSADDTVRGLFPHQLEVAQDRPLVEALIGVAAAGSREALTLLGLLRIREALPVIVQSLRDPELTAKAREALARFDQADALGALARGLTDEDASARVLAVDAARAARFDLPVAHVLVSGLRDGDRGVRLAAANALCEVSAPLSLEPLLGALDDPDEEIRATVATAVGHTRDPAGIDPLAAALADPSTRVRREAAAALGELGDARALVPLTRAAADSAPAVRAGAAIGLARLDGDEAAGILTRLVRDPAPKVREAAVTWLRYTNSGRTVRLLRGALGDADIRVATTAVESLGYLAKSTYGDDAAATARRGVRALGRGRRDRRRRVRLATIDALAAAEEQRAVSELAHFLDDIDSRVRLAAARALLDRHDRPATRALTRVRRDPDPRVRRVAGEAAKRGFERSRARRLAERLRFRRREKEEAW